LRRRPAFSHRIERFAPLIPCFAPVVPPAIRPLQNPSTTALTEGLRWRHAALAALSLVAGQCSGGTTPDATPEPSSLALVGLAIAAAASLRRRQSLAKATGSVVNQA